MKKLLDFFPPPEFLNISYAGISISDESVRCIKFGKTDKKLCLAEFCEKAIPVGVVTSGVINNTDELAKIFKLAKDEIKINHARISLPEEKTYLFRTEIPIVPKKDIKSTIEFKIEENVPLPASEILFDYIVVNPNSYKDSLEVVVSAVPSKIIDSYIESIQKAGISIVSMETKSQAIARAVLPENYKGVSMIIHFRSGKIGLYIVKNDVVHFTSTIVLDSKPEDSQQYISNEIKKLNTYWNSLKENEGKEDIKVEQIIVCGENFGDEMVSYLSAHQKVPVILGNVWRNILDINSCVPPISFSDSLKYASAVGLAIPTDILI